MSLSTTKSTQKQRFKLREIYIPRPSNSEEHEEHEPEWKRGHDDAPSWHRHFEPGELLGRYEPLRELSRGSHRVVYEGKVLKKCGKLEPGMEVAIKKVRRIFHTETDALRLLRELRILRILRKHDSIITLHDIIPPKEPRRFAALTLVLEFAGTDLDRIFRTNQYFTSFQVQYILYQMLQGTKYMHSAQIVHRDLKPANILINEECSIKIGHFGDQLPQQWKFTASHRKALESAISAFKGVKALRIPSEITSIIYAYLISTATDNGDGSDNEQEKPLTPRSKKRRALLKKKLYAHRLSPCVLSMHVTSRTQIHMYRPTNPKTLKRQRRVPRPVQSGWYEAPEVLLLQQKQATLPAVDMWSVGAIFAELLQMQRENRPGPTKRGPIFHCYSFTIPDQMDYAPRVDLMQVIFDVIGSPDESEIAKITDEKAREYLRNSPQRKKKNLKRVFPGADKHALDLFTKLLMFDADKRITVDQALEHPYLKCVRDEYPAHEHKKKPVAFSFESAQLGQKKLRELILEEVIKSNKYDEERLIKSGAMPNYKKMKEKEAKNNAKHQAK